MKKIHLSKGELITFEEACNRYIDCCRYRNLREGTIKHYRQSFLNFFRNIDKDMLIRDFTKDTYNNYVIKLKNTLHNDVSINAYLRDLISILHFAMNKEWVQPFKMETIKVDSTKVKTYTDDELRILLKKPDLKRCNFTEYSCWVMTSFLFSTGVRQRSLINIKIKDVDFINSVVNINVTKNRKLLIIPMNLSLERILKEYLSLRPHTSDEDYLFCNQFGQQLNKSSSYHAIYDYNKKRGVSTTGLHRYRHTFAKQWIINGGNVVVLSKILGHSNLSITQNYINLLISDIKKEVNSICLLDKFQVPNKNRIKLQ